MNAVDRFKSIAGQARFRGWPVVEGSSKYGEKIPFFGQVLGYQLETPNGVEDYFSILRHFGWAVTFGVTVDREVITLVQWKPGVNTASWELPPGGIGKIPSDMPEDIMERTKEVYLKETGFGCGRWRNMGHIMIETGKYRGASELDHGLKAHLFLATGLKKVDDSRDPNPNEIMETLMVPLRDFPNILESGLFVEESAVACAFKAMVSMGLLTWNFGRPSGFIL